jgi:hypothetical protein
MNVLLQADCAAKHKFKKRLNGKVRISVESGHDTI